jgi:hypothetical protein
MFIYIHKYMYKMYYVKVLVNPFDDNFGRFYSFKRSLLTFPMIDCTSRKKKDMERALSK